MNELNEAEYRTYLHQEIERRIEEKLKNGKKEEVVLLTEQNCPSCKVVKNFVSSAIESGNVRVIDINTEEGEEIADALNIKTVPTSAIKQDNNYKELNLKEFMVKFGNE